MILDIPVVSLGQFLNSSIDLFGAVLQLILIHPILSFFGVVALVLAAFGLISSFFHQSKTGRL